MSKYWSEFVHGLKPYVPGEQPKIDGLVKLNTNENPYGPSEKVLAAIGEAATGRLRLYPDPESTALRQVAADLYGLSVDQVFVGNGSDEVLAHTFNGLFRHGAPVLFPEVSYSFYPVYAQFYGLQSSQVALGDDYQVRVQDYLQPNGGIIFPNPNAPTGCLVSLADLEKLLAQNTNSVVVVDEAYIDFGGESAVSLVGRYPNLLVIQTLSKSRALAGVRVGFAFGDAALIDGLNRVKNSFNSYPLDALAQSAAMASLQDTAWFEDNRAKVIAGREELTERLVDFGFDVLPSMANFVFARHSQRDAAELLQQLRERKVLVRHFRQPGIDQFLRITVGTEEQQAALFAALGDILG